MMKHTLLILICAVLVFAYGCKPASGVGETISTQSGGGIGKVDRNYEPDKGKFPVLGEKRFAAHWKESTGERVLLISMRTIDNESGGRLELFATQHHLKNGLWLIDWKIFDFVDGVGCDLAIHLPEEFIKIVDVDADGRAEVSFIYELDNRCDASTVPAKLLLHHKDKKYAIRGFGQQYLGPPEHIMNQYLAEQGAEPVEYKGFDPTFDDAPAVIRDFASKEWDAFIESENKAGE